MALDLITKMWAFSATGTRIVSGPGGPHVISGKLLCVIPGWFDLQCVVNPGAFSGWFGGMYWFLVSVSIAAICGLFAWVAFWKQRSTLFVLALSFIAGGTAGNLYDRFIYEGVRDFLHFFIIINNKQVSWPNFNVADMGICVGVGLWFLIEFKQGKKKKKRSLTERLR